MIRTVAMTLALLVPIVAFATGAASAMCEDDNATCVHGGWEGEDLCYTLRVAGPGGATVGGAGCTPLQTIHLITCHHGDPDCVIP